MFKLVKMKLFKKDIHGTSYRRCSWKVVVGLFW